MKFCVVRFIVILFFLSKVEVISLCSSIISPRIAIRVIQLTHENAIKEFPSLKDGITDEWRGERGEIDNTAVHYDQLSLAIAFRQLEPGTGYNLGQDKMEKQTPIFPSTPKSRMKPRKSQNTPFSHH